MKQILFILLFCLMLFMPGCTGSLQQSSLRVDYYTLEYRPDWSALEMPANPMPASIKIQRFTVAPEYKTDKMIYRETSFQRGAYNYHRWIAMPADLVTSLLKRDLEDAKIVSAVIPPESGLPATYLLTGSLNEFMEYDTENGWQAKLAITVLLLKEAEPDTEKAFIYQKNYQSAKACQSKHPQAVASAMSEAMQEVSKAVIADIITMTRK